MAMTPPADGSLAMAVLIDGPAAGETVPTRIVHLQPPLYIDVVVPELDERPGVEAFGWVPTRYSRAPLFRTRRMDAPDEPWQYFHHPRPAVV